MTRPRRVSAEQARVRLRMQRDAIDKCQTNYQMQKAEPRIAQMTPMQRNAFILQKQRERVSAFTLLELLIVIGIIGVLLVLIAPAFTSIKGGTDVTSAAYTIEGVLDTARTYAKANNTYTWVGFYEEDVSQPSISHGSDPCTGCVGRLVMSTVASKDGTMIYTGNLSSPVTLDSTKLTQVGKLAKIENLHLTTFGAPPGTPPTSPFATRPAVAAASKIGDDVAPPNPYLTFYYPADGSQYQFKKVVQFTPRGEAVITNRNYTMAPVSEVGVEPTHGTTLDTNSTNPVAIQFTGFGGNVKIYTK
jgi:prepilin-type N-terminal cleavage/methylation domain-containing protein